MAADGGERWNGVKYIQSLRDCKRGRVW